MVHKVQRKREEGEKEREPSNVDDDGTKMINSITHTFNNEFDQLNTQYIKDRHGRQKPLSS